MWASKVDWWSLTEKLLHVCEAVRPGQFFVRRMLNQLGLSARKPWRDSLEMRRPSRRTTLMLTLEFNPDVTFWWLLVGGALL